MPVHATTASTQSLTGLGFRFKLTGQAPGALPILVTFALPLRNVGVLDSLLTQVSDPSSSMYRHFLTPAQVKAEFLPTADFSSLSRYLVEAGFAIESTSLDSVIVAQGTASQLESAFHDGVDVFSNGTFTYYANTPGPTFDGAYVYASNATFLYTRPENVASPHAGGNVTFTSGAFSVKELQQVYNATSLYALGDTGAGQTIGILDYYGSPTIASDLTQFDQTFGIPSSNFTITPVGPYDPNLGVSVGWSAEVSVDVEFSHAMAPSAAQDLYVANGALPLAVPLAAIVQADNVTTLSQSFGTPEWYYSLSYYFGGPAFFALNSLIPDQFYALGSVEGITFLASSGDGGGSGASSGPEGDLEYPSSSPFVTSVGGTQTYITQGAFGSENFTQTAWSSQGYVGSGAGGGGVSILEPRPWYQANLSAPATYPNGRLNPDLSLQAGLDPALDVIVDGQFAAYGGTSIASQLLSGLLTLVSQSAGGGLGLINPFLYQVGNNPAQYADAFDPITTGYTTPWTSSAGYNLATGWGAPNIGELARILDSMITAPQLSIVGEILNASQLAQIDFTPGQRVSVDLEISYAGIPVTSGSFTLALQTLTGDTPPVRLSYDASTGNWTGSVTVGQVSGISDIFVSGSSRGIEGQAMGIIYTGYLATIISTGYDYYSVAADPWSWSPADPLQMTVVATDLSGNPAPNGTITMSVETYSLSGNSYTNASATSLTNAAPGDFQGNLSATVQPGPITFMLGGDTYAYAPAVNGLWLQSSYVYPEVAAEPGSVAPGQALTVIAAPIAPVNVYFNTAEETGTLLGAAVQVGSNVSASLVSPNGTTIQTADLYYQSCAQALRVCDGGADVLYGQLPVPEGAYPGLYTVRLSASYGSYTVGGNLTGAFSEQVLVSKGMSTPVVTVSPSTLYEGQKTTIIANITYPNGNEVKFGEYTALVYPEEEQNNYTSIMHSEYEHSQLVSLSFDAAVDRWVGNLTLPSPYSQGALYQLGGSDLYYSGPYEAYVTGISYDGVPTTTVLSAEQAFFIQPYIVQSGQGPIPAGQNSGFAFEGATITSPQALTGDLFVGDNAITGTNVVISSSQNDGTLTITDSTVTIVGMSGGNIVAQNSLLFIQQSTLGNLSLTGTNVSLESSSYSSVSPSLPVVTITSPAPNVVLNGTTVTLSVKGPDVASLKLYLDGGLVATLAGGSPSYSYSLNSTNLVDGTHQLTAVALQKDGLSSSASVTFSTDSKLVAVQNTLNQLSFDIIFVVGLGLLALLLSIFSMRRRPNY